jgi:hypothetical protein
MDYFGGVHPTRITGFGNAGAGIVFEPPQLVLFGYGHCASCLTCA